MLLVGLTGGIGAGKSSVAELLAERGAVVIDADDLAREAVEPGTPAARAVRARFGDEVFSDDGSLDRAALAEIVFTDADARQDLEAIVHPEVARQLAERVAPYRGGDHVVVYAAPLLVESGLTARFDETIVVTASVDSRIARLVARGMDEKDARARIAAQATDEERAEAASILIDNEGPREELARQVEHVWQRLARVAAGAGSERSTT